MPDTVMTFTKLPISIHLAKGIDFFLKIAVFLQAICFGITFERQKKNNMTRSKAENSYEETKACVKCYRKNSS